MMNLKSNRATSRITTMCLLFSSLILQLFFGNLDIALFRFPANILLMFELAILILGIRLLFGKTAVVRWLSSGSAAITAILFFAIWVIFMATIPQNPKDGLILGLNEVVSTWMFATSVLFLLFTLGLVILKRIIPMNYKNCLFLINHLGLWITLAAGALGVADRQELMMQVYEKQTIWYGKAKNGKTIELPLAIRLDDFFMRTYPPKIALTDTMGEPDPPSGDQLSEITEGAKKTIDKYQISVSRYLPEAKWNGSIFVMARGLTGASPAALVNIKDGCKSSNAWIASGSYSQSPVSFRLSETQLLRLLPPEPSYFGSKVILYSQSNNNGVEANVSVNHPIHFEDWAIYQYGFDQTLGNESQYSIFLLVKDPWLPVVYSGIILMMMGALLLIFSKVSFGRKEENG